MIRYSAIRVLLMASVAFVPSFSSAAYAGFVKRGSLMQPAKILPSVPDEDTDEDSEEESEEAEEKLSEAEDGFELENPENDELDPGDLPDVEPAVGPLAALGGGPLLLGAGGAAAVAGGVAAAGGGGGGSDGGGSGS